ncbi:MAG: iron-sulfur cluster insertion protein ErpA [Thermodesulfobacteriota bacterium]|jgi:iron-sulfur cluster assembly accessory protein
MEHSTHHTGEHHHGEPGHGTLPDGPVLALTDVAVEKVKEVMAREGLTRGGLRVSVVGGGCSGFQYNLALDEHAREDDTVLEQGGVQVFIDPISQQYLYGVTLDYVSGLHGAGFKFINPNATRTCGCGSSFAA